VQGGLSDRASTQYLLPTQPLRQIYANFAQNMNKINALRSISGARDRNRTGKPLGGGFSSHCIFRCRRCAQYASPFRALDYAFAIAAGSIPADAH
jgi:hypothetical protein